MLSSGQRIQQELLFRAQININNNCSLISKEALDGVFLWSRDGGNRTGYLEVVLRSVDPDVIGRDPLPDEVEAENPGPFDRVAQSGFKLGPKLLKQLVSGRANYQIVFFCRLSTGTRQQQQHY